MADAAGNSGSINGGQYNVVFTERNRWSTSSSDSSNERCLECCRRGCYGMGYVFCLNKMRRSSRIEILWAWLVLLGVVGGMVTTFVVFGPFAWHIAEKDMRVVDSKVSTVFCDSITLKSTSYFSGYLYNTMPSVDTNKFQVYKEKEQVYLMDREVQYWKFYLLPESVISALTCSDLSIEVIVLKGRQNFQLWSKAKHCDKCTVDHETVWGACSTSSMVNITITTDVADDYYFVLYGLFGDTWATANFYVKRTLYDTINATDSCLNKQECDFSLNLHSSQVVLYHMGSNQDDDTTLTSTCNPRVWFYITLFESVPILIGLVLSTVLYKCCKEPSQGLQQIGAPRRPLSRFRGERAPLLGRGGQPAMVISPPKYEDLARQEAPPSYLSVATEQ